MFHSPVRLPLVCPMILAALCAKFTHWHRGQVAEVPALTGQVLMFFGEGGKTYVKRDISTGLYCASYTGEGRKQKDSEDINKTTG